MSAFRIQPIPGSTCLAIMHGQVRAAVIYPDDASVKVYPWPRTYPDLAFTGLPEPLEARWMTFPTVEAVATFLGLPSERERAAA